MTSISSVCLGDSVGLPVEVAMLSMSMENYVCACLICRSFFVFPAMLPWLVATVLSRKGEMRKNFLTCFGWRRKTFILSPSRRRLGVAFCRDVLYVFKECPSLPRLLSVSYMNGPGTCSASAMLTM